MERESFVFYKSFIEAIEKMPPCEQLSIYRAIARYGIYGEEPSLTGVADIVWGMAKPQLDANWKRYINGCKGAEYGHLGGAPIGNKNAKKNNPEWQEYSTPKQPQNNPKTTPNENDNVNVNVIEKKKSIKEKKVAYEAADTNTEYGKFLNWIYIHCPHLLTMDIITEEEFTRLRAKYVGEDFKRVWAMLERMENYKDTAKKNRNMYKTLINWLRRE